MSKGYNSGTRYTLTLPVCDNYGADITHVHDTVRAMLLDACGGYTSHATSGAWKSDTGEVFTEDSVLYVTIGSADMSRAVRAIGEYACGAARQECVLVTCERVASAFVTAAPHVIPATVETGSETVNV